MGSVVRRVPNEITVQLISMAALKVFHSYLINAEFEIVMDHISRTYLKKPPRGTKQIG